MTSFSKENVKWENIIIQGEEKSKLKFIEDKKQNDFKNNLSSKLAVILYKNELSNEWLGVEGKKIEEYDGRDIYAVFSFKEGKNNNLKKEIEENASQTKLKKIYVSKSNPFLEAYKKGEKTVLN